MLAAAGCIGFNNPEGWAGPTVAADDLLVVSTDKGELSALKMEDFSRVWTFPTGQEDPEIDLEAIYTTPLVSSDTVYLGGYSGEVYALGLDDGIVLWSFDADGPIIAGLAASDTAVYAATDKGILYALDPQTGQPKVTPFDAGGGIWGTPLLVEGVIYVASVNGKLYALDAETLDPIWDAPFQTEHGLVSDPVLADGTILVGGIGRTLHAVDAETGEERWSFKADNWFWGKPLVQDGTVYAPNLDGNLYALSLESGAPVWDAPFVAEEPLRSSPIIAGEALVIVDRDGNLYGLDPATGTPKWSALEEKALQKTVLSNPIADPPVLGVEVFISAQGGDLFRIDPAAGSFVKVVTP